METEEWRAIEGWAGYEISSYGNVRSYWDKHSKIKEKYHYLSGRSTRAGYLRVELHNNPNKAITYSIHRLVAIAFIENPLNKPQINHKNGIKTDNRADNLEWMSCSENVNHAIRTGLLKHFRYKPIMQIAISGEIIKMYKSTQEASRITKLHNSGISRAARENKTAGGFKWKYA